MKTKMITITVATLLGLAGASSALADGYNSFERSQQAQAKAQSSTHFANSHAVNTERSRQATSNTRSVSNQRSYARAESASTGIGQDHEGYGKIAGAFGLQVSTSPSRIAGIHNGYSGDDSSATGIGKDLGSYGKTTGVAGGGATGPGGR